MPDTSARGSFLFMLKIVVLTLTTHSSMVMAAAQTNVQIRNHLNSNLTIEYKRVSLKGDVTWVPIGTVSAKHARTFRNVTISSVLRVRDDRGHIIRTSVIQAPRPGNDHTIVDVR